MRNVQKPEKIHLGKLITEIKKGHFVIPDFQREFDWEPWDVRDLIKSIFMDYYVGTLLLWESNKENYEKLNCAPLYAFKGELNPEYIVLDGQQRLSALHYAFFQPKENFRKRKNPFYFYIKLEELLNENYEEAFTYMSMSKKLEKILTTPELQFEEQFFPLGLMQEGSWGIDSWIKKYKEYWEEKSANETDEELKNKYKIKSDGAFVLRDIFEDLLDNYHVSYTLLDKRLELNKVCDIFTHINSKGKALDTFDLLNSITRKEEIQLKQMYRKASQQLDDEVYPGFELKTHILMVMSILKQNYCSPKYLYYLVPGEKKIIKNSEGKNEVVTLIETKEDFIILWDKAVQAIQSCLTTLKNQIEFGAISSRFLPYPSIITCLSSIKEHVKSTDYKNKVDIHSKIKKWYWASIFMNRYSSSVESTSTKDFIDLKKWFLDDSQIIDCVQEFRGAYMDLDLHRERASGSAIYKAIFNLIVLNGARDLETFELPNFEDLDDHHIVPKSWGKKVGISNEINSILNRMPLSGNTNRVIIRDSLPNVYLKRIFENNEESKVREVLKSHLISDAAVEILLRENFSKEDYFEFIEERKLSIIDDIHKRFIEEVIKLPENLLKLSVDVEQIELQLRQTIINELELKSRIELKESLPSHIFEKMKQKIDRERKKNPSLVEEQFEDSKFWIQFTDLRELEEILANKKYWSKFENIFGSTGQLKKEFSDLANLRNALCHSRDIDQVTKMKGEASVIWFKNQMKMN